MKKTLKETFEEASTVFRNNKESIVEEVTSRAYKFNHKIQAGRLNMPQLARHNNCECIFEAEIEPDGEDQLDINLIVKLVPMFICYECRGQRYNRDGISLMEFIQKLDAGELEIETYETIKKIQKGFVMPPVPKKLYQQVFVTGDFWAGFILSVFAYGLIKFLMWLI